MNLQNPFPQQILIDTKSHYYCWQCGSNQNLELHHIVGRSSNSRLNGCVLCKECHAVVTHSQEEEQQFCNLAILFWYSKGYKWQEDNLNFLRSNPHIIRNNPIITYEL